MSRMHLLGCAVVCCALLGQTLAISCYTKLSRSAFPDCLLVSPSYALLWRIDGDNVTFGVEVDGAPGWVGLGVSEAGGMYGADITTIIKSNDGSWIVTDRFARMPGVPAADAKQDVVLLSIEQDLSSTAAQLTRSLKACGDDDMSIYPSTLTYFIWAFGETWDEQHEIMNRGTYALTLQPQQPSTTVQQEDPLFSIAMPDVEVPLDDTTYMCRNFQLPSDRKYHITDFNILPGSSLLHHLVVYACFEEPATYINGEVFECYSNRSSMNCNIFYLGWAPGQDLQRMPAEAALPFGAGSYQWFSMEVHYSNTAARPGVVDNSTINIHYTSKLRPTDMGVLTLGQLRATIPAGESLFNVTNVCPSACTSKFKRNLTLVSSFFHMHVLGRTLKTQHVRGDQEIQPIGVRTSFDFGYQAPMPVIPESNELIPGDALITTCGYDSTSRTNDTTFGLSTYQEMCYNFLQYYPKIEVDYCMTVGFAPYALCSNGSTLSELQKDRTLAQSYLAAGYLVPAAWPEYQPYVENCSSLEPTMLSPPPAIALPPIAFPPPPLNGALQAMPVAQALLGGLCLLLLLLG